MAARSSASHAPTRTHRPGSAGDRPGRPRRQPRLVQGELAARQDGRARTARLRPGAEQRLVQRRGRGDPRHPRRAVGQARLGGAPVGSSAPGSTCGRATSFGAVVTRELGPDTAVFVPRGVGNAFQTLEPTTPSTPTWSTTTGARRPRTPTRSCNLADETLAIDWPIPLARGRAVRGGPDTIRGSPTSSRWPPAATLIIGARRPARSGAAGAPARTPWPLTRAELDLADPASVAAFDFAPYGVVVNAAAYTAVDAAETPSGRRDAWATNVTGVGALVEAAREHRSTLVHVSSDYVFDGTVEVHAEDEPFSPLGVYGQTKAAGDALVATRAAPLHRPHQLGDRGREQLRRAPWPRSPTAASSRRSSTTSSAGSPSPTSSPPRIAHLLARRTRRTGPTTSPTMGRCTSWADIARTVFAAPRPGPGGP